MSKNSKEKWEERKWNEKTREDKTFFNGKLIIKEDELRKRNELIEKEFMKEGKFHTSMNRKVCYDAGFQAGEKDELEFLLKIRLKLHKIHKFDEDIENEINRIKKELEIETFEKDVLKLKEELPFIDNVKSEEELNPTNMLNIKEFGDKKFQEGSKQAMKDELEFLNKLPFEWRQYSFMKERIVKIEKELNISEEK